MPGRELLGRIVEEFDLDREAAFDIYTQEDAAKFGKFLRDEVFEGSGSVEVGSDSETGTVHATAGHATA